MAFSGADWELVHARLRPSRNLPAAAAVPADWEVAEASGALPVAGEAGGVVELGGIERCCAVGAG